MQTGSAPVYWDLWSLHRGIYQFYWVLWSLPVSARFMGIHEGFTNFTGIYGGCRGVLPVLLDLEGSVEVFSTCTGV